MVEPTSNRTKVFFYLLVLGHVLVIWIPFLFLSEFASDFELFVGRFHPSIVHLPIGVILAAVGLQLVRVIGRQTDLASAVRFLLYAGAWAAVIASGTGLLLARGGGYDADTLFWHRALGIGIATVATAGWMVLASERAPNRRALTTGILSLVVALIVIGGHFGGDLTHHEGYLTRYLPESIRSAAGMQPISERGKLIIDEPDSTTVYEAIVQPILNERCLACHNDERTRGSLSVATYESTLSGGGEGTAVLPGAASESPLVQRIWLPPDHVDHMPPIDRPQITVAEAEILRWWIDNGASQDETFESMETTTTIDAIFMAYGLGEQKTGIFALDLPQPDTSDVSRARNAGLRVSYLSQDVPFLEVSCIGLSECLGPEQIEALEPLTAHVAHFDAAENNLPDAAVEMVARFEHLTHARLEKTGMTDSQLALLQNLQFLEVLNIYGTPVTDSGLVSLADMPALRTVYTWETGVTGDGVRSLLARNPRIEVDQGTLDAFE